MFLGVLVYMLVKSMLKEPFESSHLSVFIDNMAAKSMASMRKTSLRSLELAIICKALCALQLAHRELMIRFYYIPTDSNAWADVLSRNVASGAVPGFDWESMSPFVLCNGTKWSPRYGHDLAQLLKKPTACGQGLHQNFTTTVPATSSSTATTSKNSTAATSPKPRSSTSAPSTNSSSRTESRKNRC